ncbi:MAG: SH3 domain-containing protein [Betaproteobacteria bacterium]|nr:SH3 domain-containing protein [Betaproteobacteria bacterium]
MMRRYISRFLIAAGLLCSAAVFAQQAWTTRQVNVRAGPDREYPLVATLDAGTQVEVVGCVEDYRWCDIFHGEIRGWVYAKGLQYAYESRRVPIYGYGAIVGLPIVTFSILSYWDNYYTNRPFYRDRPRWEHRPYPGGPGWVPSPREPRYFPPRQREPQVRPQRPGEPQVRPPRPVEPQFRPARPVEPQYRPPRPVEPQVRPQRPADPQVRPPHVERPQVQPPERAPSGEPGSRAAPRGERSVERGAPDARR